MKYWKIHLAWALAVPLVAFLWGRWTVLHREPEARALVAAHEGPPPRREPGSPSTADLTRPQTPANSEAPQESEDELARLRRLLISEKPDRAQVARLLHRVPDGPERKELILLELASPDSGLRHAALNNVIQLLGADGVPYIQAMLKSDTEAYLRRSAAEVLGNLGGTGTIEALLGAVHDPERFVQVTAAGALNHLGQPGPAEDLVPRVAGDLTSPDGAVRREAVKDLTLLKLPSTIPILLRSLRDSDGEVRLQAATGLGDLHAPDLLPSLEALRKDPDQNVADAAQNALTRYQRKNR